ncbi:MAG: hypothetical protein ABIH26_12525 [Candidatus Eisenbacteria bacterium]
MFRRVSLLVLLAAVWSACSPPALFLEPVTPSLNGIVAPAYRDLPESEVEALFVRPYTGRTLLETSGTTAAMLYDLAYLEKRVGAKAGANEALYAMNRRYIEEGISFRVAVWGEKAGEVDLARWRFQLRTNEGRLLDPILVEPQGVPEFERESFVDRKATWRSVADVTFPIRAEPPLSSVVLEIGRDGDPVQRHTWKFDWVETPELR